MVNVLQEIFHQTAVICQNLLHNIIAGYVKRSHPHTLNYITWFKNNEHTSLKFLPILSTLNCGIANSLQASTHTKLWVVELDELQMWKIPHCLSSHITVCFL